MKKENYELYLKKDQENKRIIDDIEKLNLHKEWSLLFISLCLSRAFVRITSTEKSQMINISTVNSHAVKYLALQAKKVGLNMLEDLSIKIEDEKTRLKAVQLIMDKGVKPSKNDLNLIISTAKNTKSLFDEVA